MKRLLIAILAIVSLGATTALVLSPEDNVYVTCPPGYHPATRVIHQDGTKAILFCRGNEGPFLIDIGQSPIPTPQRMREMPKQP